MAVRRAAALGDPEGDLELRHSPSVGNQPRRHFIRQPFKYQRQPTPGLRRSADTTRAGQLGEEDEEGEEEEEEENRRRNQSRSADSYRSPYPDPGSQRRRSLRSEPLPQTTAHSLLSKADGSAHDTQTDRETCPCEVPQGAETVVEPSTPNPTPGTGDQEAVERRRQSRDEALNGPARKILSGLKLRRSHSGLQQHFV